MSGKEGAELCLFIANLNFGRDVYKKDSMNAFQV
jgi:hypothetical protein